MMVGLFVALLLAQGCSSDSPATSAPTQVAKGNLKKIPASWIEKIRRYNYKQDSRPLLAELEGFIKPDTLNGTSHEPHLDGGVLHPEAPGGRLNPLFINLDEDPAEELIGLFGYSKYNLSLCVFKQVGSEWFLLYKESFDLFNEEQELQLANTFSPNKVFYVRKLYGRGTCNYSAGYQFYKLVSGRVYPCLELLSEASSCSSTPGLDHEVKAEFRFNCTNADELWVNYSYSFYVEKPTSRLNYIELPLLKDTQGFVCVWDSISHAYKPDFGTGPNNLNKDKLKHLLFVVNDKKFVQDFSYEIKQTMQNGSSEQKAALREYLAYADKKK